MVGVPELVGDGVAECEGVGVTDGVADGKGTRFGPAAKLQTNAVYSSVLLGKQAEASRVDVPCASHRSAAQRELPAGSGVVPSVQSMAPPSGSVSPVKTTPLVHIHVQYGLFASVGV